MNLIRFATGFLCCVFVLPMFVVTIHSLGSNSGEFVLNLFVTLILLNGAINWIKGNI